MTTVELANKLLTKMVKGLTIKDIIYEDDLDDKPTYGKAFVEISKDYLITHSNPMYRDIYKDMKAQSLFPWNGQPPDPNYPDIRILKDFADSIDEKTLKKVYLSIYQSHFIKNKLRFRHLSIYFGPYEGFFEEPLEYLQ
jgi:hypothetical protein